MVDAVTSEKNYIAFCGDNLPGDPFGGAQTADSVCVGEKTDTDLFSIFRDFILRVDVAAVDLDHSGGKDHECDEKKPECNQNKKDMKNRYMKRENSSGSLKKVHGGQFFFLSKELFF